MAGPAARKKTLTRRKDADRMAELERQSGIEWLREV